MSKYFQRMFMLFSLSFGYLFYDTYSYFWLKNVVLTICCVLWVCFGYREQQTIVIFAIVDDRFWQSGPKF